jgi:cytochrome P450
MSASQETEQGARCPMREDYNPFSPEESKTHSQTALASMARQDPVFFNPTSNWWTVAGYEEVREVLRETKRFSSTASILEPVETSRSAELAPNGAAEEYPTLINNDPPEHRRIRKLTNQAFTPKAVASWGPAIEERVAELIDRFIDRGRCEFVSEFAEPLPIVVIMELLGIPKEEYDNVMHWSESLLMTRQPDADEEFLI